jgi:hypothetical protein
MLFYLRLYDFVSGWLESYISDAAFSFDVGQIFPKAANKSVFFQFFDVNQFFKLHPKCMI